MKKSLLIVAALGATTLSAPAQVTRSGAGYLLRVKYVKGQVIRLDTTNSVTGLSAGAGANGKTQFKTPITLNVLQSDKDKATIRVKMDPVKFGNSIVNPGQTAVVTLDNRNRPVGGEKASGVGAVFPEKVVKIGQTWSGTLPVSTQMASGNLTATYKFVGVKSMDGKSVAVITYTVKSAANSGMGLSGTGTMTLLAKDGTLNSNQMKLSMKLGETPMTLTSSMVRA